MFHLVLEHMKVAVAGMAPSKAIETLFRCNEPFSPDILHLSPLFHLLGDNLSIFEYFSASTTFKHNSVSPSRPSEINEIKSQRWCEILLMIQ